MGVNPAARRLIAEYEAYLAKRKLKEPCCVIVEGRNCLAPAHHMIDGQAYCTNHGEKYKARKNAWAPAAPPNLKKGPRT